MNDPVVQGPLALLVIAEQETLQAKAEIKRLHAFNAELVAALTLARRSMIVSVTGVSDGLTIHDIRQWIERADAAIDYARGGTL